jgi:hypothetical protein
MTDYDSSSALDGNAVGGLLIDVFGSDLTGAMGECATCGTRAAIAEAEVYLRAPGTVVRCRSCRSVLMVLVAVRGTTCVERRGLVELELG